MAKILSLFDGMSCGYLAMLKAEVPIDRYVAYEIDKYAVQTSKHNFPDIEHRGDVFDADFTEFEGFDGIKQYLTDNYNEGIVFWKDDEPQCKIKRTDFGLPWGSKNV